MAGVTRRVASSIAFATGPTSQSATSAGAALNAVGSIHPWSDA